MQDARVASADLQREPQRSARNDAGEHLAGIAGFFDSFADQEERWHRRNRTYHRLIASLHRSVIAEDASVLEIGCGRGDLLAQLRPSRGCGVDVSPGMIAHAKRRHPDLEFLVGSGESFHRDELFDYVVLSDLVPYAFDLEALLETARSMMHRRSRLVINSYAQSWRPLIRLAEALRLKPRKPIRNWVAPADITNLLALADLEVVTTSREILLPIRIPFLATFLNGVLARVWGIRHFCLTWWIVARPRPTSEGDVGVSVVVPCRNEAGMIAEIVDRIPDLGTDTEILFVEGGSTDGTREAIEAEIAARPDRRIELHTQTGKGKGDAVRLGFERASNDLLVILDADLTVAPESLDQFYRAVVSGHADLANGSRLVYNLESGAMQYLNVLGNKFFSAVFSALLGQAVKDTLCGTKVLRRSDYLQIAKSRAYFGDFDPFGDFDLLLGAGRQKFRIIDIPVRYSVRRYGQTNISRFRHGWLLLRMAVFGFYKLKIKPIRV